MKNMRRVVMLLIGCAMAFGIFGCDAKSESTSSGSTNSSAIPLKEAKLIIEHNATDKDTGFQGFIDSEGWERLEVTGPNGKILAFEGQGKLSNLGLTELFFETVEPENAKQPIKDVLATLPEGNYVVEGPSVEGEKTKGTVRLTHKIPAGPVLVSPAEGATVARENLVMRWKPVTKTIKGDPVEVISYQLIIEKDGEPHPTMIGGGLSIYLPASVTSLTAPQEFLKPDTDYLWEVLAIEESGNQTLSSGTFKTR